MAKNLQTSSDELLNERSKLQRSARVLQGLLNEFAASSNGTAHDYDVLCDLAADLAAIYAQLRVIALQIWLATSQIAKKEGTPSLGCLWYYSTSASTSMMSSLGWSWEESISWLNKKS